MDESSNQKLSHLDTPSRMCITIRSGIPYFILHPTFREETSYAHQHTSTGNTSYTLTHMFKVSACSLGALHQIYLYFNTPHASLAHVHMTKILFFFCFLRWQIGHLKMRLPPFRAHLPYLHWSLHSVDGICLGDICFAKICTTLWMHAVSLAVLKKWIENGNFKPREYGGS